ncbi:hypothetical protein WG906_07505 [Pedobacter sp. P351]|uniref:hypothetical protein n=1 Tax=Pedobacter superstes TaxID=3133441 RepID=UPI0030AF2938
MIKLAAFLLFFCTISQLAAQTNDGRSLIRQARYDVRFFKLDKVDYIKFLRDKRNSASDYFKPFKTKSDYTMILSDSTYVKEFRKGAYNKTRNGRLNNYMAVIGSAGIVGVAAVIISGLPTGK